MSYGENINGEGACAFVGASALQHANEKRLDKASRDLNYCGAKLMFVWSEVRKIVDNNYYKDSSPNVRHIMSGRIQCLVYDVEVIRAYLTAARHALQLIRITEPVFAEIPAVVDTEQCLKDLEATLKITQERITSMLAVVVEPPLFE